MFCINIGSRSFLMKKTGILRLISPTSSKALISSATCKTPGPKHVQKQSFCVFWEWQQSMTVSWTFPLHTPVHMWIEKACSGMSMNFIQWVNYRPFHSLSGHLRLGPCTPNTEALATTAANFVNARKVEGQTMIMIIG